jgi:hypothetical protein
MSTSKVTQPFVYGRPVRPGEFVDRGNELRTIFNRLRHGESTAVVGTPHSGKSSVLLQIADAAIRESFLGEGAAGMRVTLLDLHPIDTAFAPASFWEEALEGLAEKPGHATIRKKLDQASDQGYSRRSLVSLFRNLAERNQRLVLLLDEFDRILVHPNFAEPSFFALLRSLVMQTGGLAMIVASRASVAEMNRKGRGLLAEGSPFFNHFIELRLGPFDNEAIEELFGRTAKGTLSQDDRRFTCRVAGRHPFLLQAMAATLLETTGESRQIRAAESFYERIAFHFDDLWESLGDRARTAAVMLSLLELGGRALGESFNYGEVQRVDAFGPELRELAKNGLAERIEEGWQLDWKHLLLWRGERWSVGGQAFAWWIRDVVLVGSREVRSYEEWLADKRYGVLLTQEQWEWLTGALQKAPDWAVRGVAGVARSLLEELTGRK